MKGEEPFSAPSSRLTNHPRLTEESMELRNFSFRMMNRKKAKNNKESQNYIKENEEKLMKNLEI